MDKNIEELLQLAKEVCKNSYSPYSRFPVGAALEDASGKYFSGCNIENISFPVGICAEQTTIGSSISALGPQLRIKNLVIYTPTQEFVTPCGQCRQMISEFASEELTVYCFCDTDSSLEIDFKNLFPSGPEIQLK